MYRYFTFKKREMFSRPPVRLESVASWKSPARGSCSNKSITCSSGGRRRLRDPDISPVAARQVATRTPIRSLEADSKSMTLQDTCIGRYFYSLVGSLFTFEAASLDLYTATTHISASTYDGVYACDNRKCVRNHSWTTLGSRHYNHGSPWSVPAEKIRRARTSSSSTPVRGAAFVAEEP